MVKIGIRGAIAKVGVTRSDSNYNYIIMCVGVSGIEVEWKSVGAKLKVIKMAQMAKSWNGVDIIYEWNKYDAKIDTICIIIASGNGE